MRVTVPVINDNIDAEEVYDHMYGLWRQADAHATDGRLAFSEGNHDLASDEADALLAVAREIVACQTALIDWWNALPYMGQPEGSGVL